VIRLAPPIAECRILTFREGLLSSFGHDLEIAVTRFDLRIDEQARSVDASFDAASLRVLRALRDGVELPHGLTDRDRKTIEEAIRRDVLETSTYSEIRFRSTRVVDVDGGFDAIGRLALHGDEHEITAELRRVEDRYAAEVRVHQLDFGIRPYSAFLGAMKVKPDVLVRLSLPVDPPR
jgi:polyisoprenoid-binding protein YceI